MLVESRVDARKHFLDVWRKMEAGAVLEPLQAIIADVIAAHPEYHAVLAARDVLTRDYSIAHGETNPFLHMGLHVSVREQAQADWPRGVAAIHRRLAARIGDQHVAEHRIMDCLAASLWQAQQAMMTPDEAAYLAALRRL